MLRNNLKGQVVGLNLSLVLCGCSVEQNDCVQKSDSVKIEVKSDEPFYEFRLRNILETLLTGREVLACRGEWRKIRVILKSDCGSSAFSKEGAVLGGRRIVAHVEILDDQYKTLFETTLDSWATLSASDEIPYSSAAANRGADVDMLNDIGRSIACAIMAFARGGGNKIAAHKQLT